MNQLKSSGTSINQIRWVLKSKIQINESLEVNKINQSKSMKPNLAVKINQSNEFLNQKINLCQNLDVKFSSQWKNLQVNQISWSQYQLCQISQSNQLSSEFFLKSKFLKRKSNWILIWRTCLNNLMNNLKIKITRRLKWRIKWDWWLRLRLKR